MITPITNELFKRRQTEREIKKYRMEILSQYVSLYNRLALYTNWNISFYLHQIDEKDRVMEIPLIMYYVCDFLQLRKQLIHSLGTLQFDNIDADTIINNLERRIINIVKEGFSEIEFSKLSCLVDDNTPYHEFIKKLEESENKMLFNLFQKLLANKETKTELEKHCRWYSELIMFELTHIYKIWYKEEPKFYELSQDLREKLDKDYPKYYKRIKKIGTSKKLPN